MSDDTPIIPPDTLAAEFGPGTTGGTTVGAKPLFMSNEDALKKLRSGEAMASARRLIDHYFKKGKEPPCASIPARPDHDMRGSTPVRASGKLYPAL